MRGAPSSCDWDGKWGEGESGTDAMSLSGCSASADSLELFSTACSLSAAGSRNTGMV